MWAPTRSASWSARRRAIRASTSMGSSCFAEGSAAGSHPPPRTDAMPRIGRVPKLLIVGKRRLIAAVLGNGHHTARIRAVLAQLTLSTGPLAPDGALVAYLAAGVVAVLAGCLARRRPRPGRAARRRSARGDRGDGRNRRALARAPVGDPRPDLRALGTQLVGFIVGAMSGRLAVRRPADRRSPRRLGRWLHRVGAHPSAIQCSAGVQPAPRNEP